MAWARGDVYFDTGRGEGEGGKEVREKLTEGALVGMGNGREEGNSALHAPGATGPVTVVEVEAFTLQDECADAVLYQRTY